MTQPDWLEAHKY